MNDWIDIKNELPPCDGLYEITNDPESIRQLGCLLYDGIGFKYDHAYKPVEFWRHIAKPIKRYGKIE